MHKMRWITGALLLIMLLVTPLTAGADDGLEITLVTDQSCDKVDFTLTISGGTAPYHVKLDFGDTEIFEVQGTMDTVFELEHAYPAHGEYEIKAKVTDDNDLEIEYEDEIVIDGPKASLESSPSPPLLTIDGGKAAISFEVDVSEGVEPYTYSWDLDEDGLPDDGLDGNTATYSYSESGKYSASVTVTDSCGLVDTDKLTVVVDDPEEDAEEACHPMAQRIAENVSELFPDRAGQPYNCDDIFNIFEGALTGNQLGFGRMWKAYQLTQTIDDLTWEDILDWHLNYSGWGALVQLDRVSDLLEDYSIVDLMKLVISDDDEYKYSLSEIRSAARSVLRYEADFEDALLRISEGVSPGELGQFYKLAAELEVDPETLDQYLADGLSLSELRHASKLSERIGSDWSEVAEAKGSDFSWGEIGQAYKLADEETTAAKILAIGVKEYQAELREEERTLREEDRAAREVERNNQAAERMAEQFNLQAGDVISLFNGDCEGSWSCVRKALREQQRAEGTNDRDLRTAEQLASKYGVSTEDVMAQFAACGQDWNCVRAYYRNLNREPHGKDKTK
jgi:PKD repeat protein